MKYELLTENEKRARERLCIALDTPSIQEAKKMALELADFTDIFKIGLMLYVPASSAGVRIVQEIKETTGRKVFLDLKYHDKHTVVYEAAKAAALAGADMLTVHIEGGMEMCRAALNGAYDGALNDTPPAVIGVTVLTTLSNEEIRQEYASASFEDLVKQRTDLARGYDLDGITCTGKLAPELEKLFGTDLIKIAPGVSLNGRHGRGQKHVYEPKDALIGCTNSIIVAGSAVTDASDRRLVAYKMLQAMAPYV